MVHSLRAMDTGTSYRHTLNVAMTLVDTDHYMYVSTSQSLYEMFNENYVFSLMCTACCGLVLV